ncbi:hypothetical protein C8F01DRAFT_262988 [Mycena amicta]|nr:hypothetical protein C8F01DRAFT_262988 [Mycena amicta]
MIVTENTPKTPPKSTTPLLGESSVAPPAYAPPVAGRSGPYIVYQQPAYPPRPTESAGARFLKAFVVAVGIWLLASALLGSIFSTRVSFFVTAVMYIDEQHYHRNLQALNATDYPIPDNVDLAECTTEWINGPKNGLSSSSLASFTFPIPSQTLLFLSKGSLSGGRLKIITSDSKDVQVRVTVHYSDARIRDLAKVCLITREDDEAGVGIFTPNSHGWRSPNHQLSFDVEIALPRSKARDPRFINALFTDVSNFSQEIESLQDVVTFGTLTLTGSNGGINSPSLVAGNTTLRTSNGGIKIGHLMSSSAALRSSNAAIGGTYVTKGPLDLTTSNGNIDVVVSVTSDTSKAIPLTIVTSNARLSAIVDLISTSGKGGSFTAKAHTSNGQLSATLNSLPLDATLSLDARTSNTRAEVSLPLTYEGKFSVSTSNSAALVKRPSSSERDPACPDTGKCDGRRRTVNTRTVRKTAADGVVHWDKANAERGDVSVRTSNGPLTLVL